MPTVHNAVNQQYFKKKRQLYTMFLILNLSFYLSSPLVFSFYQHLISNITGSPVK